MAAEKVNLKALGRAARAAARRLAAASTQAKNAALEGMAATLRERRDEILAANRLDLDAADRAGLDAHMKDRLMLDPGRIEAMAEGVHNIAALPDPVGEVLESRTLPNGLRVERRRTPLGVIGVIYESRPNVTIDIAALCLKAGNAVILRGGSESINSNTALSSLAAEAIASAGLPGGAVQFVRSADRALVAEMLRMDDYIDLLIPRGSAGLVRMVAANATMPAVTGGIGVCHTYVDRAADLAKARAIVVNAKVQRPTVCNALDTVLVHAETAPAFLPLLADSFAAEGVEMRCDRRALSIIGPARDDLVLKQAGEADWGTEFLSLVAAVRVVDSLDEALAHIERHGSGHSEAIVSEDAGAVERFLGEVDAGAVFANTSTRFNDGGEFGLGAEVAISTSKMHARGPMGLREITSYKWIVRGDGQVRT
ncbi:MAG: glutamate-5-semialdehyde dehydrogenase [Gemmatimonadetes bacterium]|nr:glutamate-5-semialdehyde dehydrogenase [Gemmatimonadota bacterium]